MGSSCTVKLPALSLIGANWLVYCTEPLYSTLFLIISMRFQPQAPNYSASHSLLSLPPTVSEHSNCRKLQPRNLQLYSSALSDKQLL
ncbi:UNVERIFIED_CONTAM: hypothetical protein FKN15_029132 [Acipenser sinensis]